MAKVNKAPLAGQPGYDPFPDAKQKPMEVGVAEEMGPREVLAKPKRESSGIPTMPAKQATAVEFLAFLLESGTNNDKLIPARAWLAQNDGATAEQCFRFLEAAEEHGYAPTAQGTLRKAGKWLWGSTWELEAAVLQNPTDEINKLRGQAANLEGQMTAKNADLASTKSQNAYLLKELAELRRQNDYLKLGKSPDELAAAGIDAGKNVTADA